MTQQEEINYFRIKSFDYNDVFDYSRVVKGTYEQVKQYLIDQYRPEFQKQLDIEESTQDIYVLDYMPVTDEEGNEISKDNPNYEEIADQQELRLDISYSAELIEQSDIEGYTLIDLTDKSN